MDMISLHDDFTFDSKPQPVTTSSTMQRICRVRVWGRRALASVIVLGGTIADIQVLQAAYPDDPFPQVIADGLGLNSPALADESYIIPALTLPFGPGVFQVHLQGDACELIFQAQGASGSGVTVQVKGSCSKIGIV
jgi:hypothetical protein